MDKRAMEGAQGSGRIPLQGERLSLRPLEVRDLEAVAPYFANTAELYYYLPDLLLPRTAAQLQILMDDWNDGKRNFVFACRAGEETLGLVSLSDLDAAAGSAEAGIVITEPAWRGQGLAREALTLLLDYAFGDLRLHRIFARVAVENHKSLALFENLGFVREGRMRQAMRRGDRYIDLIFLGLLEEEYRQGPTT